MSVRSKNERMKRKYLNWLGQAEGLTESTVIGYERAICLYDEFSGNHDYATFSQRRATAFKDWVQTRRGVDKGVSITTAYNQIRYVKAFFKWLAGQPGYKSRVKLDAVSYLTLERKKVREATAPRPVKFPSFDLPPIFRSSLKDSILDWIGEGGSYGPETVHGRSYRADVETGRG
jgi:hypothetical protein